MEAGYYSALSYQETLVFAVFEGSIKDLNCIISGATTLQFPQSLLNINQGYKQQGKESCRLKNFTYQRIKLKLILQDFISLTKITPSSSTSHECDSIHQREENEMYCGTSSGETEEAMLVYKIMVRGR